MAEKNRGHWLGEDVSAQREGYLLRYTAVALALALLGYGLWQGNAPLAATGVLLLLLAAVLLGLQVWVGGRLALARTQTPRTLRLLSQVRPIDRLLSAGLGDHSAALLLSSGLTTGRLTLVDIYNPEQAPRAGVTRLRAAAPRPPTDPRLVWYNGSVNLLPLPDGSVRVAVLDQVLSELVHEGDRDALLREVARVLEPNGRLLLVELADGWPLRLRAFPGGPRTEPLAYWQELLQRAGLRPIQEEAGQGLLVYLRADKVSAYGGYQLPLDFGA